MGEARSAMWRTLVGALALLVGLGWFAVERVAREAWVPVAATVCEHHRFIDGEGDRVIQAIICVPTPVGSVRVPLPVTTNVESMLPDVGTTIPAAYDPYDPRDVQLRTFGSRWYVPFALVVASLVTLLFGTWTAREAGLGVFAVFVPAALGRGLLLFTGDRLWPVAEHHPLLFALLVAGLLHVALEALHAHRHAMERPARQTLTALGVIVAAALALVVGASPGVLAPLVEQGLGLLAPLDAHGIFYGMAASAMLASALVFRRARAVTEGEAGRALREAVEAAWAREAGPFTLARIERVEGDGELALLLRARDGDRSVAIARDGLPVQEPGRWLLLRGCEVKERARAGDGYRGARTSAVVVAAEILDPGPDVPPAPPPRRPGASPIVVGGLALAVGLALALALPRLPGL